MNAEYTMTYHDALAIEPTLFSPDWDDEDREAKLKEMVYAKFFNWEISGETLQEQRLFMQQKFIEYRDYYGEMLDAYEEQIEWLDGVITSEKYEEDNGNTREFTAGVVIKTTDTPGAVHTTEDYDLPRSASTENRPSSKSVSTPSGNDIRTVGPDTTSDKDVTEDTGSKDYDRTVKSGNPIEQKQKMLKLIRNLYSEFAERFRPCFIEMWS